MKNFLSILILCMLPIGLVYGSEEAVEVLDHEERKIEIKDGYFAEGDVRGAAAAVDISAYADLLEPEEDERIRKLSLDGLLSKQELIRVDLIKIYDEIAQILPVCYDIFPLYDYVASYNLVSLWWYPNEFEDDLKLICLLHCHHENNILAETLEQYQLRIKSAIKRYWFLVANQKARYKRGFNGVENFIDYYKTHLSEFAEDAPAKPQVGEKGPGELPKTQAERMVIELAAEKESKTLRLAYLKREFALRSDCLAKWKVTERWDAIKFQALSDLRRGYHELDKASRKLLLATNNPELGKYATLADVE